MILAILAGFGLGYIIERGDLCFHSMLRGFLRSPRRLDLFPAYLLTVLVAAPVVYALIALGLIDPWIPPFAWQANLIGGIIFGIGMRVAATCVTGMFYKLGHGMLGTLVALATWALGDIIIYRGPLSPLHETLNRAQVTVDGQSATTLNLFGPLVGIGLIALVGLVLVVWLWRSPQASRGKYWSWGRLGVVIGSSWWLQLYLWHVECSG